MNRYPILVCLLAYSLIVVGQDKTFEEMKTDNEWNDGSIMLNDGTELKGLVRFDDREGIVNYKNGDVSRSLTPRTVTAFEFLDGITQKQRIFYALEHEDPKTNAKRPLFFEVVKDFKTFVVLLKMDPIAIENKPTRGTGFYGQPVAGPGSNGMPYTAAGGYRTDISQTETIYFMNTEGTVEAFLKVTRKVIDRTLYDREKKKSKIVDRHVIGKYFTAEENRMMEEFAEKNDLSFHVKEDLIEILDFCWEYREKKQ